MGTKVRTVRTVRVVRTVSPGCTTAAAGAATSGGCAITAGAGSLIIRVCACAAGHHPDRISGCTYGVRKQQLAEIFQSRQPGNRVPFKEIPQKPCVMISGGMIIFFYVDDIVICYRKKDEKMAKTTITGLKIRYAMNELESLK